MDDDKEVEIRNTESEILTMTAWKVKTKTLRKKFCTLCTGPVIENMSSQTYKHYNINIVIFI